MKVDAAGAVNSSFNPSAYTNGTIYTSQIQNDGKIVIGGIFTLVNGVSRNNVARLNLDGSNDNNFNPGTGTNGITNVNAIQSDGKIVISGISFSTVNGVSRNNIARLNIDGSLDTTFDPGTGAIGYVGDTFLLNGGKILIAGGFTTYNGTARSNVARLNSDGSLDLSSPTFNAGTNTGLSEAKVDVTGGILLVGGFTTCNSISRNSICRVTSTDGTTDNSFNPGSGANNIIYSLGLSTANTFFIAGDFTQYNAINSSRFAKIQSNGVIDSNFSQNMGTGFNNSALLNRVQSDGKPVVVGSFTDFNGIVNNRIARLNQDGTFDRSFKPANGASDTVNFVSLTSTENTMFVGGLFSRFSCSRRTGFAKLIPGNDPSCQDSTSNLSSRNSFDFDGDGKSDISVFRASDRNWYLNRSSQGFAAVQWGLASDKLAPADFDGDGKTDVAVWREGSLADFYVLNSADNTVRVEQFGQTGDALTVGDWDGDGKADPAVYRDSAVGSQSYFYYRGSNNNPNRNVTYLPWGTTGDKPQLGDFDNDGKADAAVFRPSNATWYIRQSSDSLVRYENWGLATDKFVPADYDGDGKTDLAVFRNGTWYIRNSSNNQTQYINFGIGADIPVPADYDGDGKADVAVFRNGTWYLLQSTSGVSIQQFGLANDKPVPAAFIP